MSQNIRCREPVVHRSGDLPLKVYHTCYVKYHWHDEYEFLLSDEDGALCTVGGRKIVLNRGDCLMIQGGELHSLSMSLDKSITAIVVHPRLWSGELVGTPPEALEFTAHFVHGTALCGEISALLHRVIDCCRIKASPRRPLPAASTISAILSESSASTPAKRRCSGRSAALPYNRSFAYAVGDMPTAFLNAFEKEKMSE